jgi:Protein of unknown function (DUF2442)
MVAVTEVEALEGYRLRLRFDDGAERTVDLSDMLWGTMGEPLRDPEYFRQVRVDPELRTVVWPNGLDLDPEVLHGDYEPAPPHRPARVS